MRDKISTGTPVFICLGVLAFLLTVGAQLYMKGAPASGDLIVSSGTSLEAPQPDAAHAPVSSPNISLTEHELSAPELTAPSRPVFIAAGDLISTNGAPIESADVRLFLVQGDQERELTRVLTDETGHFESVLDDLSELSTESFLAAKVEARIVAANHMPLRERIEPLELDSPFSPKMTMVAGHFLRGRIVNNHGDPVAHCAVDLYLNCPPGTPRRDTKRTDKTDRHGEFVFGWKRGQGVRFIDAEHTAWGKATIALSSLSTTEDQEIDDIRLDPGGVLAGSVACKFGGDLLPGVRIDAHPSASNRSGKRKWTFTGNDGSFHLSGLVPGEYKLWVEDAPRPVGTWRTGSDQIELEVDLVRLVVSVRDPRDNPLPGQRVQFVNIAGSTAASLIETSSDTSKGSDAVVVFTPAKLASSQETKGASRRAVAMRATSVSMPTYEELIDIPEDACRIDHTFTLLSTEELGRLRVRVKDLDDNFLSDPVITLTSLLTGEQVTNLLDLDLDPEAWMSTLPPGGYDLQVSPRLPYREQNMILDMSPNEVVQIRKGHETRIDLQSVRGGRVRLLVDTEEPSSMNPLEYPSRTATAKILPANSATPMDEAPALEIEMHGQSRSAFPVRKSVLSFGVLDPGSYRIQITCPGFEEQYISFQVKPGEISEHEIEMLAQ